MTRRMQTPLLCDIVPGDCGRRVPNPASPAGCQCAFRGALGRSGVGSARRPVDIYLKRDEISSKLVLDLKEQVLGATTVRCHSSDRTEHPSKMLADRLCKVLFSATRSLPLLSLELVWVKNRAFQRALLFRVVGRQKSRKTPRKGTIVFRETTEGAGWRMAGPNKKKMG